MNYILTPKGELVRDGELYHYGVKGMKWGVRRKRDDSSSRGRSAVRAIGDALKNTTTKHERKESAYSKLNGINPNSDRDRAKKFGGTTSVVGNRKSSQYERDHGINPGADREKMRKIADPFGGTKEGPKTSNRANDLTDFSSKSATKAIKKLRQKVTKEKAAEYAQKGAKVASKAALMSLTDDVFYGGAGKKILKEVAVTTGRAAVTAYTMANGGYDIKWFDKQGRRVG